MRSYFATLSLMISLATSMSLGQTSVSEVLDLHAAALESYDTVSCRFESKTERIAPFGPPSRLAVGQYWRMRDRQKFVYQLGTQKHCVLITPEKVFAIATAPDPKAAAKVSLAHVAPNAGHIALDYSPWRHALMAMDSEKGLPDHVKRYFKKATVQKNDRIYEIISENKVVKVLIDPSHNYLVCGKESDTPGVKFPNGKTGNRRVVERVIEYVTIGPMSEFPGTVILEEYYGGELLSRQTTKYTMVKINQPITPDVFLPDMPPGTKVTDMVDNITYVTSQNGRRVNEEPFTKIAVGPNSLSNASLQAGPTLEEPSRDFWWLIPVGGVLVFISLAYILWKRVKRQ